MEWYTAVHGILYLVALIHFTFFFPETSYPGARGIEKRYLRWLFWVGFFIELSTRRTHNL